MFHSEIKAICTRKVSGTKFYGDTKNRITHISEFDVESDASDKGVEYPSTGLHLTFKGADGDMEVFIGRLSWYDETGDGMWFRAVFPNPDGVEFYEVSVTCPEEGNDIKKVSVKCYDSRGDWEDGNDDSSYPVRELKYEIRKDLP